VSFVDLLLLVLLIAITATGFFQGTIRIIIALVTFYASIVLASLYFSSLAVFFINRGTNEEIAFSISFFIILLICFFILFAAGVYTFRYVRLPGQLDYLDRIIGTLLGLLLAGMVGVIVATVLDYAFVSFNPAATASFPITAAFQRSVRSSVLVPALLESVLPRLHAAVAPFLPEAALRTFFRQGA
jgi:uncharacterized membrane protein required for colicin V production